MLLLKELFIQNLGTYWMLRIFLFGFFIFAGWGITYKNKNNYYFWYYAIPAILFYSLIEGLRFDRGIDYYHYYQEIQGLYNVEIVREPLYQFVLTTGQALGTPYWLTFIFYSFILVLGLFLIIRQMPKLAIWALPLFIIITINSTEIFIRQYLSFAFVYIAFAMYLDNKKIAMYLSLLAAVMTHFTAVAPAAAMIGLSYFDVLKRFKTPIILLGIYILIYFTWTMAGFDQYANMLVGTQVDGLDGTQFQAYIDNSDRWLSSEGSVSMLQGVNAQESIITSISRFLSNCCLVWFGFYAYREDKRLLIPYVFTYIGIIIFQMAGDIELIMRMGWWFRPFECFIAAAIISIVKMSPPVKWGVASIFLIYYLLKFLAQVGKMPQDGCAFVWDIL